MLCATARRPRFYAGAADDRALPHRDRATIATISRAAAPALGRAAADRRRAALRAVRGHGRSGRGRSVSPRPATIWSRRCRCRRSIRGVIEAFVAEHHVERPFFKRKRDRADPEALARRGPLQKDASDERPENFLSRWSRRKREVAAGEAQHERRRDGSSGGVAAAGEGRARRPPARRRERAGGEPAFDLASLPPIESITAETDIRAFLAPGVPAALTRAALRRVWVADPAIRDFVGLAEITTGTSHAPDAIAGLRPARHADGELKRQVVRIVGQRRRAGRRSRAQPQSNARPTHGWNPVAQRRWNQVCPSEQLRPEN